MNDFELGRGERKVVLAILRQNALLYFLLSRFFTREELARLAVLYVWLKQAHELLDLPDEKVLPTLKDYQAEFRTAWKEKPIKHLITLLFVRMAKAYDFDPDWCELYLESLQEQAEKKSYENWRELNHYLFASGEMIVHMLAALFDLKSASFLRLREIARWWQQIQLLRSIGQDWEQWQRVTIPEVLLREYDLTSHNLVRHQHSWQFYTLIKEWVPKLQQQGKALRSESRTLPPAWRGVSLVLVELGERQLATLLKHPYSVWQPSPTHSSSFRTKKIILATWWKIIGKKKHQRILQRVTSPFAHIKLRKAESRA